VQLATGDIIYDTFDDSTLRSELETRLQHIQPVEILIPNDLVTTTTKKMLDSWSAKWVGAL
jgi:DNA mismatch repair protein MSH3